MKHVLQYKIYVRCKMFQLKKDYVEYENKSLRLPKDLIESVNQLAIENDMSFNRVVIQMIEYALANQKK